MAVRSAKHSWNGENGEKLVDFGHYEIWGRKEGRIKIKPKDAARWLVDHKETYIPMALHKHLTAQELLDLAEREKEQDRKMIEDGGMVIESRV